MYPDAIRAMQLMLSVALIASSEAFFLKWGSDSTSVQSTGQNTWVQPIPPNMSPSYQYQYTYPSYTIDSRQKYQIQPPQYQQNEVVQQNMASIPISVPAGASLTPVSLQHVQLVPCMCPVAPEEAEKLQGQVVQGPYVAQAYSKPSYIATQEVSDKPSA